MLVNVFLWGLCIVSLLSFGVLMFAVRICCRWFMWSEFQFHGHPASGSYLFLTSSRVLSPASSGFSDSFTISLCASLVLHNQVVCVRCLNFLCCLSTPWVDFKPFVCLCFFFVSPDSFEVWFWWFISVPTVYCQEVPALWHLALLALGHLHLITLVWCFGWVCAHLLVTNRRLLGSSVAWKVFVSSVCLFALVCVSWLSVNERKHEYLSRRNYGFGCCQN